jgi:hypothetical protein
MQPYNVPNFDAMAESELMDFWFKYHRTGPKRAKEIFGSNPLPPHYVRVTWDLANYACNKAVAMGCRLKGQIDTAISYEKICDQIYDRLPLYARW